MRRSRGLPAQGAEGAASDRRVRSGTNPSARTGETRSKGSPDPFTSYSSSNPVDLRFLHTNTSVRITVTVVTFRVTEWICSGEFEDERQRRGPPQPGPPSGSGGRLERAHDLLADADANGLVPEADLPWVAEVAYAAGHLDATIEAWERAHTASVRGGYDLAAAGAAVRVAMHVLFDTALMAPVRGSLSRAERLIKGREPSAVHAWLAVVRSYERLLSGDVGAAPEWARQAVDIGTRLVPAAAAIGRVAEARCLIRGQGPRGAEGARRSRRGHAHG